MRVAGPPLFQVSLTDFMGSPGKLMGDFHGNTVIWARGPWGGGVDGVWAAFVTTQFGLESQLHDFLVVDPGT